MVRYDVLWPIHGGLLAAAFVLMLVASLFSTFFRKNKRWFKLHKRLALAGVSGWLSGVIVAVYMVAATTGMHFRVAHSFLALGASALILLNPFLGYAQVKAKKERKPVYRALHRWVGRAALVVMFVTIVFGLIQVDIL